MNSPRKYLILITSILFFHCGDFTYSYLTQPQQEAVKADVDANRMVEIEKLAPFVEGKRVILIGEQHSISVKMRAFTKELLVYLYTQHELTHLFLEIDDSKQEAIDQFLKDGTVESLIKTVPRLGIQALLQAVYDLNQHYGKKLRLLKVVADDRYQSEDGDDPGIRDQWMFDLIQKTITDDPSAKLLVCGGNNHMVKSLNFTYPKMGELLKQNYPELTLHIGQTATNSRGELPIFLSTLPYEYRYMIHLNKNPVYKELTNVLSPKLDKDGPDQAVNENPLSQSFDLLIYHKFSTNDPLTCQPTQQLQNDTLDSIM